LKKTDISPEQNTKLHDEIASPNPEHENLLFELFQTKIFLTKSELQRVEYVTLIKEYEQKVIALESQNQQLLSENKCLKEILSGKFDNQQVRIECITTIAQKERKKTNHLSRYYQVS